MKFLFVEFSFDVCINDKTATADFNLFTLLTLVICKHSNLKPCLNALNISQNITIHSDEMFTEVQ